MNTLEQINPEYIVTSVTMAIIACILLVAIISANRTKKDIIKMKIDMENKKIAHAEKQKAYDDLVEKQKKRRETLFGKENKS